MIALPGGAFTMGSDENPTEKPVHEARVRPFAIGRYPVTVGEWKQCVAAKACLYEPAGEDAHPVSNLSWDDAQQYVAWLTAVTGKTYRLPTEAEWEYAARGGTNTRYWWGPQLVLRAADCRGCGSPSGARTPMPAGSFAPNPFGLHDMGGGVEQWVADCWSWDYNGAPANGSARDRPNCRERALRGGSWLRDANSVRPANRNFYDPTVRYPSHGLRVLVQSPATAPARLPLPAPAQSGPSDAGKWKVLVPTVRASTDCIARAIVASPIALGYARQKSWGEAVGTVSDECKSLRSRLVAEHDRLYGPGTGKRFFEGRYAADLPRALRARIGPQLEREQVSARR